MIESRHVRSPRPLATFARLGANLFDAQQDEKGFRVLHSMLASFLQFRNFIVFEFSVDRAPTLLDSSFERGYLMRHMADYLGGLYQLDPFYRLVGEGTAGLFRMDDIAPEDFRESEFFVRHYKFTDVIDELRYVVPVSEGRSVHVFIERESPMSPFAAGEVRRLQDVTPFILAFVASHVRWRHKNSPAPASRPRAEFDLRAQIQGIAPGEITSRESDVIELMLKGHSVKSIASELTIEEGTVTNHKRNIYAKLGVHSQAQLFDRFLRALAGQGAG